jgi:hypothetical protein
LLEFVLARADGSSRHLLAQISLIDVPLTETERAGISRKSARSATETEA